MDMDDLDPVVFFCINDVNQIDSIMSLPSAPCRRGKFESMIRLLHVYP